MKRVFTLFCALMLLLTSFSGMLVSATAVDTTMEPAIEIVSEAVVEDVAEEVTEEPAAAPVDAPTVPTVVEDELVTADPIGVATVAADSSVLPKNYTAALEGTLGDQIVAYVQPYFASCTYSDIDVSRFNLNYYYGDFEDLTNLLFYEAPELFNAKQIGCRYYTDSGNIAYIYVSTYQPFADTSSEYNTCLNAIREARDYLVRDLKDTNLSDVELALILHDRIAMWNEYDCEIYLDSYYENPSIYSAVGPLMNQLGVCQGIALAYSYVLDAVGIESDLCLSDALNHAWNIVYIDGVGYHVDITWDDDTNLAASGSYYYLTNTYYDNFGRVKHDNFLLSSNGIWNTGHEAYDYNTTPNDTRYDNSGWWRDTETAVVLVNDNQLYFRSKNDGHIYQYSNGSSWVAAYTDGYKGQLSANGPILLYNTQKDVYSVDTSNGSNNLLWSPESIRYNAGFIEGLKYEKGKIYVQLNNGSGNYNSSWREEMAYAEQGTPLQIVTQPTNAVAPKGKTAKITLKATGDGLKYTWYYAKKGATSWSKSGNQKTNVLSLKMSSAWHGAKFYCVVSDMYGNSVRSKTVTMYMGNPATITTQPTTAVAPNGKTAKIAVKATGDGLKYTWYYAKKGATSWSKSGNQKTNVLSLKMSSSWNGAKFYCVVTDKYGNSVKTNAVKMYMGNPAKIATQPKNAVVVSGKTAKFTVKATGDGLKYTWYYAKKGATSWTKSGNQKTNVLSLKMSSSWNGAKFYCVVTDKYGTSVKTGAVSLTMAKLAKIVTQPVNTVSPKNKTVKVSVKATGDGLKYQWYYAKKGSSKYKKTSVTTATYSVKMTSSVNGRKVYCVVSDKYGNSVKTKTVTLTQVDTKKVVAKSWKGTYEYISDGRKYSISNLSIKITSAGKVTLKVPKAGVGYNKGTFTYKLKYVKCVGDTVYYQFTNNIETLSVTYKASNKKLTVYLSDDYRFEFKIK